MDHRCTCCEPSDTPAEDCPPGPPCATRTVTVSFSISPKSCNPVEAIGCEECTDFCGGKVKGCDCSQLADLAVPSVTFGTGYADAAFWVVWHTHYTTEGYPCVGTLVPCGGSPHYFTEILSGEVSAVVSCVSGGAPNCTTEYAYYPSEAAWSDPDQSAVKFKIDASWCEVCECDGLAPWCAAISVEVQARFVLHGVFAKSFGFGEGTIFYCECEEDTHNALQYPAGIEELSALAHYQYLTAQFERRILASQTECGPAPGNYTCKAASWQNQMMTVFAPGLIMLDGVCSLSDGNYYDGGDTEALDGLCDPETSTCGKGSMASAGWNITVEVV